MKILCLFSGMGLASLGLRQAGHSTLDVELNPITHSIAVEFARITNIGHTNFLLGDATTLEDHVFEWADAIWASPPCQTRSAANVHKVISSEYAIDHLEWSLNLAKKYPNKIVWVENVLARNKELDSWGTKWNAHQFSTDQSRNRLIGGNYPAPVVQKEYKRYYPGICPTITATEHKGCASDTRRASRFYGRRLTVEECAYHMGIPDHEKVIAELRLIRPPTHTVAGWNKELYTAIGNGVPVQMARAFGDACKK